MKENIDFTKFSELELLKIANDTKKEHEILRDEIVEHTHEMDSIHKKINEKLSRLDVLENRYVKVMQEMTVKKK
ncbi:MAG: hypothetical protein ACOCVF_01760 [bacterium]